MAIAATEIEDAPTNSQDIFIAGGKTMRTKAGTFYILIAILFLFLFPNIGLSFTVSTEHPRILITSEDISILKARCGVANSSNSQYNTHYTEYQNVKSAADYYTAAQIESFDGLNKARMAIANAFVYLMEGDSAYFSKAKVLLDQISSLGQDDKSYYGFYTACIIYDWLYNDFSSAERSSYSDDIINFVTSSSYYPTYDSFDPYYHDRKFPSSIFAFSGQAIYNEDPTMANEFISRSITVFNRMIEIQTEIAEDGFIYPIGGATYSDESGLEPVLRVLAGLKLSGVSGPEINGIDYSTILRSVYGEIYSSIKLNKKASHDDCISSSDKPWSSIRNTQSPFFSSIFAMLYEGDEIGRLTNYLQSNYSTRYTSEKPFLYLGSILFNNKNANEVGNTVTKLPKTKIFDDTVLVHRSGWNGLESDKKEVYINFYAPKHVNGHTHYAKGHFDIWRGYDPLAFASGNYGATSSTHYLYYGDSLAHNVMLIRNPNEDTGSRPNDGGQLTQHGEGDAIDMHSSGPWRVLHHTEEGYNTYTGSIKRSSIYSDYAYAYFHYPTSYSSSKVDDLSRSFVHLGNFVVILDRVNGVNASFSKKWLLHSIGTPTIIDSGSWDGGTELDNNGGTPNQTSSNAKLLSISEGDSSLFIKSVYPSDTIVHRVGGSADYRFYSYNEGINYSGSAPSDGRYGNWRIEIESNMGTVDDVFLTVLYPTSTSGSMPDTIGLEGTNFKGTQINDLTTTRVVVFSNSTDESNKESGYRFSVDPSKKIQLLACDLSQGIYNIYLDDNLIGARSVKDNSTLYLEYETGGTFEILPSNLSITGTPSFIDFSLGDSVIATWDEVSGAAGYNVYRTTTSGRGYTQINSSLVTDLSYHDESGIDGVTYYYVITAVSSLGVESDFSNEQGIEYTANDGDQQNQIEAPTGLRLLVTSVSM